MIDINKKIRYEYSGLEISVGDRVFYFYPTSTNRLCTMIIESENHLEFITAYSNIHRMKLYETKELALQSMNVISIKELMDIGYTVTPELMDIVEKKILNEGN